MTDQLQMHFTVLLESTGSSFLSLGIQVVELNLKDKLKKVNLCSLGV